jgi:hypothetical protein
MSLCRSAEILSEKPLFINTVISHQDVPIQLQFNCGEYSAMVARKVIPWYGTDSTPYIPVI